MNFNYSLPQSDYTYYNVAFWGLSRRHLAKAREATKWNRHFFIHLTISFIEVIPIIGQIASLFEKFIVLRWATQVDLKSKLIITEIPPQELEVNEFIKVKDQAFLPECLKGEIVTFKNGFRCYVVEADTFSEFSNKMKEHKNKLTVGSFFLLKINVQEEGVRVNRYLPCELSHLETSGQIDENSVELFSCTERLSQLDEIEILLDCWTLDELDAQDAGGDLKEIPEDDDDYATYCIKNLFVSRYAEEYFEKKRPF